MKQIRRLLSVILLFVFILRSSSGLGQEKLQVSILPLEGVNIAEADRRHYRDALLQTLQKNPRIIVQEMHGAAAAPLIQSAQCSTEIHCLQEVGNQLRVQKLLALRVGRLSDTFVLRLSVFDVERGIRQGSWQEVLRQTDNKAIYQAIERIANSFFTLHACPVSLLPTLVFPLVVLDSCRGGVVECYDKGSSSFHSKGHD